MQARKERGLLHKANVSIRRAFHCALTCIALISAELTDMLSEYEY